MLTDIIKNSPKKHPLLQSQLHVFVQCMQYPESTHYNLATLIPLGNDVDTDRIANTLHVIYNSRVAWRIRFGIDSNGVPYQYADDTKVFNVVRSKMTDAELQEYASHDFERPFDLMGDEPLVRVEIVSTEKQHYLLTDMHHCIMDGVSYSQIWSHKEFGDAYRDGFLPEETYTMLDAADEESDSYSDEAYNKAKAYCTENFAAADFETLCTRAIPSLGRMIMLHEYIDRATVDDWCREQGVVARALFQAAFSYVMSVMTHKDKFAFTSILHGRFNKACSNIMGMFVRPVPMMSQIRDNQSVTEYINSCARSLLPAVRHIAYPFTDFHRDIGWKNCAMFNFFAFEESEESIDFGGFTYRAAQLHRHTAAHDINVEIYLCGQNYDIRVRSSELLNDEPTVRMIASSIRSIILKMMAQPDAMIKSITDEHLEAAKYFSRLMQNAVSLQYPYAKQQTADIQQSTASITLENSAAIHDYCSEKRTNVEAYLQSSLLFALMRLLRQDNLVMYSTAAESRCLPLVGRVEWMDKTPVEAIALVNEQYSQTLMHGKHVSDRITSGQDARKYFIFCENGEAGQYDDAIVFSYSASADGTITLHTGYPGQHYTQQQMQSLLEAWYMIATTAYGKSCPVKILPIVTPSQQERLLAMGDGDIVEPHDTNHDGVLLEGTTIVDRLMDMAEQYPDRPIITDSNGTYTLGQLNRYSNMVAHWIVSQGIVRGSFIGILTPRGKEYLALAFGVLKAGCGIVTLEEDYPEQRRQQIIEQADIRLCLTIGTLSDILSSDISDSDICLCDLSCPFQIFFTSGSTGQPKGVLYSMTTMANYYNNLVIVDTYREGVTHATAVRFSFIASFYDVWCCIIYGCHTHIIGKELVVNLAALDRFVREHNIHCMLMPASLGVSFINNYDVTLKKILLAAEKIQPITNWNVQAVNVYACTETFISKKYIKPNDANLTAGAPRMGTQIYILDDNLCLLPQGTAGEICVSSTQMSDGYYKNPELNAAKFVANPFVPGKRLYRTGDIGYLDENGELNVMGRKDNMVKLRGFRIELDEIAHTAMRCAGIDLCACVKLEVGNSESLCCYYTSAVAIGSSELKTFIAKSLPPYMVPDIYMMLDKMPLNANGKIDRKALPEPVIADAEEYVAPSTPDEQVIAEIVEEMFGWSSVSVTANLISSGMSSISAMRLAMRLSVAFSKSVQISQILNTPTIRDIAGLVATGTDSEVGRARDRQELYPLPDAFALAMRRCYENRDKTFLNITHCLRLKREYIDPERLRDAIVSAIDATPIMKAHGECIDGTYYLRRRDEAEAVVELCESDTMPDYDYFKNKIKPFNPLTDDWYRVCITTCEDEVFLFFDILHLIADGVSLTCFIRLIMELYAGKKPEPVGYTYFDYTLDLKEKLIPRDIVRGDRWYDNMIRQCGPTIQPCDLKASFSGFGLEKTHSVTVDGAAVKKMCRKHGTTESDVLLTITMMAVQEVTGMERFVMGIFCNERYGNDQAFYNMVGFMLSRILVGTDHVMHFSRLADEVQYLHKQTAVSYTLSHYPQMRMVERGYFPSPYCVPFFLYQGDVLTSSIMGQFASEEVWEYSNSYAQDGLVIEAIPTDGDKYLINLIYDTSYFSDEFILRLGNAFDTLLNHLPNEE